MDRWIKTNKPSTTYEQPSTYENNCDSKALCIFMNNICKCLHHLTELLTDANCSSCLTTAKNHCSLFS